MKKISKKAQTSDPLSWIYRFIIIIIVIGMVVVGVIRYYNHKYDIRPIEAPLIANKVLQCLGPEIKLNKEQIESCLKIDDSIFLNISYKDSFIEIGDKDLQVLCEAQKGEKKVIGQYLPHCFEEIYPSNENEIKINIAIAKGRENV